MVDTSKKPQSMVDESESTIDTSGTATAQSTIHVNFGHTAPGYGVLCCTGARGPVLHSTRCRVRDAGLHSIIRESRSAGLG